MRLFFIAKQYSVRRDFIADRYFRLWHFPAELARRGHQVYGFATAYRRGAPGVAERFDGGGALAWETARLRAAWPFPWLGALRRQASRARSVDVQAVIASSDALHLACGQRLAHALGVPLFVDFYDNYESYGASRLPGARRAIAAAARAAAGTLFVSDPLRRYLLPRYGLQAPALTLENGVEHGFAAGTREAARRELGLPADARIVGTAGALDASRGIDSLYGAFLQLARERDDVFLALAGDARVAPPAHPRVRHLGTLSQARMPQFWRALDVAAICLRDDPFGRYCYPQKLPEIAAVGTPMVFPRIGVFADADAGRLGVVAPTADAAGYAAALRQQLAAPMPPQREPQSWAELGARLETFLAETLARRPATPASASG